MVAGVCGGIADMFNFDPTLVRLITVALILFSASSLILVYILCAVIIPLEPTPGYILRRHQHPEGTAAPFRPEPASDPVRTASDPVIIPVAPEAPQPEEVSDTGTVSGTENGAPDESTVSENAPVDDRPAESSPMSNDDTVINSESDRY